ncbi:MAG: type VI secretion system-associated FHA domain protein [Parashewanella sp.]
MSLSIRIICSPSTENLSSWTVDFPDNGGEIGRAYGCVMQLNDASRTISSTHAVITKSERGYQILDNSTNGLFINGSQQPLGKGNQSTLNDGDVLSIGEYRLLVSCFSTKKIVAEEVEESTHISQFTDDPFSATGDDTVINQALNSRQHQPQPPCDINFTLSTREEVGEDPFINFTETQEQEEDVFSTSFENIEDDPFNNVELDTSLDIDTELEIEATDRDSIATSIQPPAQFDMNYAYQQLANFEKQFKQQMDNAIDSAILRLLNELSPDYIEDMFNDIVSPGLLSAKPKYWEMYKRYFDRQLKNNDWQVKFHAYLQDSLKQQRNVNEE